MSSTRFVAKQDVPSILRNEAIRQLYSMGSPDGAVSAYMENLIGCTAAQALDILFGRVTLETDGFSVVLVEEPNTRMGDLHRTRLQKEMQSLESSARSYMDTLHGIESCARARVKTFYDKRPWDVYAPCNDVDNLFHLLDELPDFLNGAVHKLRAAKFCASHSVGAIGILKAENAVRKARSELFRFCNSSLMKEMWHSTKYHVQEVKRAMRDCSRAYPDDHQTVWVAPDGTTYGCSLGCDWLMPEIDLARELIRRGAVPAFNPSTDNPDSYLKQCGWLLCCREYVTGAHGMEPTPQQLVSLSERAVRSYDGELRVGDGLHRVYLGSSIDTSTLSKLFN